VVGSVEMEVIAVVAVGFRAKDSTEGAAGALVQLAQNTAFCAAVPMVQYRNIIAIAQLDRGDVYGVALGMFRQARAGLVVTGAAGVMRRHLEARDPSAHTAH